MKYPIRNKKKKFTYAFEFYNFGLSKILLILILKFILFLSWYNFQF